jgi:endonuclease/exonuclease/phosphatase family metal-dependent hydrolase
MLTKILLAALTLLMLCGAIYFEPSRSRSVLGAKNSEGTRLRLLTWNIGYADLEDDTRAHTNDLEAVAETILKQDPDAVALQELTGANQLEILLRFLKNRYRGAVCPFGKYDRVEAVLIKNNDGGKNNGSSNPRFENIASGDRFALSAIFHLADDQRDIVFISAHADAFNAARRRTFTADVIDWARTRTNNPQVFIAGDFNLELTARNTANVFTDNVKNDSEAYSYILKYYRDLGRDAGQTAINDRRIDYIFGAPATTISKAEALRGAAVGRMDHWPLLVEVTLKKP